MKKGTGLLLIISFLVLVLIIIVVKSYSSLTTANEEVINRESDLKVQLTRKKEQISNLLNTSSNYFVGEEALISEIETTLDEFAKSNEIKDKSNSNEKLSTLLNKLFENITPELLNKEEISTAIDEIISTEKRITTATKNYNNAVDDYNSKVSGFPSSIIASIRGFSKKDVFEMPVEIKDIREKEI